MQLMRRLRFPAKMVLMAVVLTVPLAWLTAQALASLRTDLAFTRAEVRGAAVLVRTLDLVVHTQKHRGLVNRALAGDASVDAALADTRQQLKTSLAAVQQAINAAPEL